MLPHPHKGLILEFETLSWNSLYLPLLQRERVGEYPTDFLLPLDLEETHCSKGRQKVIRSCHYQRNLLASLCIDGRCSPRKTSSLAFVNTTVRAVVTATLF